MKLPILIEKGLKHLHAWLKVPAESLEFRGLLFMIRSYGTLI